MPMYHLSLAHGGQWHALVIRRQGLYPSGWILSFVSPAPMRSSMASSSRCPGSPMPRRGGHCRLVALSQSAHYIMEVCRTSQRLFWTRVIHLLPRQMQRMKFAFARRVCRSSWVTIFMFWARIQPVDVVVEKRMAPEVEKEPSAPADDDGEVDWESGVLPKKN